MKNTALKEKLVLFACCIIVSVTVSILMLLVPDYNFLALTFFLLTSIFCTMLCGSIYGVCIYFFSHLVSTIFYFTSVVKPSIDEYCDRNYYNVELVADAEAYGKQYILDNIAFIITMLIISLITFALLNLFFSKTKAHRLVLAGTTLIWTSLFVVVLFFFVNTSYFNSYPSNRMILYIIFPTILVPVLTPLMVRAYQTIKRNICTCYQY